MTNRAKWIFGMSGFGKDAMYAMSTIMSVYFITYLGMNPGFVGAMFMAVRVWDAVNDPIMGSIVENTKSKWGKFRPWIFIGTLLNSIILVFVFFNPGFGGDSVQMMIYVSLFYLLWGMSYTLMDIPFWSMIPALTKDPKKRESISTITRFFTSVGFMVISAAYINFASLFGGGDWNPDNVTNPAKRDGFLILAIIVSVIFLVSQIIMVLNVKEQYTTEATEKVTFKGMFKLLKENDQLMVVMLVVLIVNFTLYITSTMAFYYLVFDVRNADESLFFPFLAIGAFFQLLSIGFYPLVASKLSRKQMYNFSILVQVAAFILLFINAFFLGNTDALVFVGGAMVFVGQGFNMVLVTVLLADTVEYGELKTGKRSEAVVFSVQTFVVKLATGLSMGVVGLGLLLIGFQADDVGDDLLPQSDSTIWGIRIMMFILPIFGMLVARYIFNKKHIIDEAKYQDVIKELEAKRGE